MKIARKEESHGYIGRILLLRTESARKYPLVHEKLGESSQELYIRTRAVQTYLESIILGSDVRDPGAPGNRSTSDIFRLFIYWQDR